MKTDVISGFFDVRKYDKKVERKDRKIVGEGENITFNASFPIAEVPDMFKVDGKLDEFCKPYLSKGAAQSGSNTPDRVSVKFKIGSGCHWFDKYGKECSKPSNEELDGAGYEVRIDFKRKAKNPNDDKAPSGYWVNAIMFRKKENNPFIGEAFEQGDEDAQTAEQAATENESVDNPDLPF